LVVRKFLARGTSPVGATTLGRDRVRSYAVPMLALVVVVAVGWWAVSTLETTLKREVKSTLTTIRDADVAAIRIWLQQQTAALDTLAVDELIRVEAETLMRMREVENAKPEELIAAPHQKRIRALIAPYMKVFGYIGFGVFDRRGRVVASVRDESVGRTGKDITGASFNAMPEKPYVLPPFLAPEGTATSAGATMAIVGPLCDADGNTYGAIGFRIEPTEFTKLLTIARMGESGETYAFNRAGRMISFSRFEKQLRGLGLIAEGEKSLLNISIRDPGVDLTTGAEPERSVDQQPLTLMAADAIAGGTGANVDGYRDYRGVEVLGAWTWLKEYEFGVTTEIDKSEAYAALGIMRLAVWILIGLLVLGAGATFFGSMLIYRLRAKVNVAQQLGSYTLEGKIGEGAMGEVFRASHSMLRRPTAIKMLRAEHASGERMARFEREVQLTSRLMHHNTVAIYDYGRTPEGTFYYAMEYVAGVELEQLVRDHGPMPAARVHHILRQACGSLAEAHGLGLIHRDIKPANMMLCPHGGIHDMVKILDFGLVKDLGGPAETGVTVAGKLVGTPLYMAPEMLHSASTADGRCDLYALGGVAYYLLCGEEVFMGETVVEVLNQHINETPRPLSMRTDHPIPRRLEELVLRCLAKSPDDRPGSAAELLVALDELTDVPRWTAAQASECWDAREKRERIAT